MNARHPRATSSAPTRQEVIHALAELGLSLIFQMLQHVLV